MTVSAGERRRIKTHGNRRKRRSAPGGRSRKNEIGGRLEPAGKRKGRRLIEWREENPRQARRPSLSGASQQMNTTQPGSSLRTEEGGPSPGEPPLGEGPGISGREGGAGPPAPGAGQRRARKGFKASPLNPLGPRLSGGIFRAAGRFQNSSNSFRSIGMSCSGPISFGFP